MKIKVLTVAFDGTNNKPQIEVHIADKSIVVAIEYRSAKLMDCLREVRQYMKPKNVVTYEYYIDKRGYTAKIKTKCSHRCSFKCALSAVTQSSKVLAIINSALIDTVKISSASSAQVANAE